MVASIFSGIVGRARQGTGGRGRPKSANAGGRSAVTGRAGAANLPVADAQSTSFQMTKAYTLSTATITDTVVLNLEEDVIGFSVTATVALTGNTNTTSDQLSAFPAWQVLGPDGVEMNILPAPDFYMLEQRFSPLHVLPSTVNLNGTTATSGTYLVYGISLPKGGNYNLLLSINPYTSIGTATTGGTVTITLDAILGKTGGKISRYLYSGLPFTPSANGVNDLAPVAPIQDTDLTELFISGLTSNTADISYIQTSKVGARILPSTLVAKANAAMISALPSTELFPLFSLQTDLNIGRGAHFLIQWGASPSSSIRLGFYWLQ